MRIFKASEWLKDPTLDQNLKQIDDIELTQVNDKRKWFSSRILQSIINYGGYNNRTGRVMLGDNPKETRGLPSTQITAAAIGSATLTCPAGHYYYVTHAAGVNNSGASDFEIVYTPAGGTGYELVKSAAGLVNVLVGLIGYDYPANTTDCVKAIWMGPGDTLVTTDNSWGAGENEIFSFAFIDYTV